MEFIIEGKISPDLLQKTNVKLHRGPAEEYRIVRSPNCATDYMYHFIFVCSQYFIFLASYT